MIDNNKNTHISDQDDEPTTELEQLSEETCAKLMLAENASAAADEVPADVELPVLHVKASVVQELREELQYRVEMNSILQLGIEQQRERCRKLAEKVSSLQKVNEKMSFALEQSRQQELETKQLLVKSRDAEQALRIDANKFDESESAHETIAEQGDAIGELERQNISLTHTISDLETKLELAAQNTEFLEARINKGDLEKDQLLVDLSSKNTESEDYEKQLAAMRRSLSVAEQASERAASGAQLMAGDRAEEQWVLVGLDAEVCDIHAVGTEKSTVGSSPDCDIRIRSEFVSRHHAQVVKTQNGFILEDLNSTNGTFINARRVKKRVLRAGDIVAIGKHRFRYERKN